MLAFYFTQMEFSVIEISRMGRQAEKVAGLSAGHGTMCRLPMPCLPSRSCVSGSQSTESPSHWSPLGWASPAIWGNLDFTHNPSFRSFSPACKRKPRFIGYICHSLERLLPAPSHSL